MASGCDDPRDVLIQLLDGPGGRPLVAWLLCAARPVRWSGRREERELTGIDVLEVIYE